MQYHYLLVGMEDLQQGQKPRLSLDALLELLEEQMSARDFQYISLLRKRNDDPSILAMMEDDAVKDRFAQTSLTEDDFRTQLLYEQGMHCHNKFLRSWFAYNLNLNNVLAAAICQKHGYDVQKAVVGDNEVAEILRNGGMGKNQTLAALLPDLKEMIAVSEIQDLLEREKHIDALRWQWLEQATLFEYFELDNVLAYYLQSEILHRWDNLTREQGEQIFRSLLADMKRDVHFD